MKKNNFCSYMKTSLLSLTFLVPCILFGQNKQIETNPSNTAQLLAQFIQSKGAGIISFDASNIKQFWVDNSVVSRKDSFDVLLTGKDTQLLKSVPLKIQLMNVNETQNCKVEVIAETKDFDFSVLNEQSKVLSTSQNEDDFLTYSIKSAVFPLEKTQKLSFNLRFDSKSTDILAIKNIILTFSKNKESSFLASPGKINYSIKDINTSSNVTEANTNSFSANGIRTAIYSTKKIIISDNTLKSSVTIKNTGDTAANIYVGYRVFAQDATSLDGRNYPFKSNNKVLGVISASEAGNKIIVDGYTEVWEKGCYLALNAKEDMSDIPNVQLVDGKILEIKKLENGQAEITLDKPLQSKIEEGTIVRVHGKSGSYLYSSSITLKPGEEQVFASTIQKDDSFLQYSPQAFSRGVYYVIPLILSYSTDPTQDNLILISNYSIEY